MGNSVLGKRDKEKKKNTRDLYWKNMSHFQHFINVHIPQRPHMQAKTMPISARMLPVCQNCKTLSTLSQCGWGPGDIVLHKQFAGCPPYHWRTLECVAHTCCCCQPSLANQVPLPPVSLSCSHTATRNFIVTNFISKSSLTPSPNFQSTLYY